MTLGAVFYVMEEILVWGPKALYDLFNKHECDEHQVRRTSYGRYRMVDVPFERTAKGSIKRNLYK